MAKLIASANAECVSCNEISSLQSLSALVWRCITRLRNLPPDQTTSCKFAVNNRSRLDPPISKIYFGNLIYALGAFTAAGELLVHDLGWAAWKVHQAVTDYDDKAIYEFLNSWLRSAYVFQFGQLFDRFNKYGSEFGMGKALALRSGSANKFDGQISCYPGRGGGGSIDLEMCLSPDTMRALESNEEFMEAAR